MSSYCGSRRYRIAVVPMLTNVFITQQPYPTNIATIIDYYNNTTTTQRAINLQ